MEVEALDRVVQETLMALESGKEAIYDIAENARSEVERVQEELLVIQRQTLETIQEVDRLTKLEKQARLHLMTVSRDFHRYDEETVKGAYDRAMNLQVRLFVLREQEKNLRQRRDELERSLRRLRHTVEKAEMLVTRIGVVLQFLHGTLSQISVQLGNAQKQQQLALKVLLAQEEERRRIAREIHDGPAQALANIVLRADYCEQLLSRDPAKLKQELEKLKGLVRASLRDIRKIIFDLRPMPLDDLGLAGGVRRFLEDFQERYGLPVEFLFFGRELRYDPVLEVAVFRIIQEALNNAQKHAAAGRVTVKLELHPRQVLAVIRDDGKGFVPGEMVDGGEHYGLINMRERARFLGGEVRITSAPGEGTEVIVMIPVCEEEEADGED
ncbi:MAG: two-component system, NarL family, sensor histidine kinase DegS [Clostridia bacterium]|nr:two-component system, NarL family, sensor histidine kinase DegS [Clostridia bacterium]